MKHLVIVRHAKSVPYGYDEDFHRDLKKRGETDSVLVSKKLKELNFLPGLIISSPALRAKRTAKYSPTPLVMHQKEFRLLRTFTMVFQPRNLLKY